MIGSTAKHFIRKLALKALLNSFSIALGTSQVSTQPLERTIFHPEASDQGL